jgi:hypothetical protein
LARASHGVATVVGDGVGAKAAEAVENDKVHRTKADRDSAMLVFSDGCGWAGSCLHPIHRVDVGGGRRPADS